MIIFMTGRCSASAEDSGSYWTPVEMRISADNWLDNSNIPFLEK